MTLFETFIRGLVRVFYAIIYVRPLILLGIIQIIVFYLIRNLINKKIKKTFNLIIWHPTLEGGIKMLFLIFHIYFAFAAIVVYCPINEPANLIPLYALYQLLIKKSSAAMVSCLYNALLVLPVGLWLGEVLKPVRSTYLFKWTSIIMILIGAYMEYGQYSMGVGRPAVDDIICMVCGICFGIFCRDAYEKVKQFGKQFKDLLKNQKRKKEKEKLKEMKKDLEKSEKEATDELKKETEETKKKEETEEKNKKRKESFEAFMDKFRQSKLYNLLSDGLDLLIFAILSWIQKIAEVVKDKDEAEDLEKELGEVEVELTDVEVPDLSEPVQSKSEEESAYEADAKTVEEYEEEPEKEAQAKSEDDTDDDFKLELSDEEIAELEALLMEDEKDKNSSDF